MSGGRSPSAEYATRVNAAAELLDAGVPVAEAARVLAARFGCSIRQGRRYAERAAEGGRVAAVQATTVFTVKLPPALVDRVRAEAAAAGSTISTLVAQALTEFLARGRRKRPDK
jgi:predicted HicB family RNase H-like nuclease